MKEEQKKLKSVFTLFFWINMILFVSLALFMVSIVGMDGQSATKSDFAWERFSIILTVAIIPLSLKLFHSNHKKIASEELPIFLTKLKKLYYLRILALDIVILLNFAGFYCIGALNFIYMAAITIFVFLMCYPTESMVDPIQENITTNDNNN